MTIRRPDPIDSPGKSSRHVHAVVGSTTFNRNMPGALTEAKGTEATFDKLSDHSNYWKSGLYQTVERYKFKALPFTGMLAYYTNYTCNWNASGVCPVGNRNPRTFPKAL